MADAVLAITPQQKQGARGDLFVGRGQVLTHKVGLGQEKEPKLTQSQMQDPTGLHHSCLVSAN